MFIHDFSNETFDTYEDASDDLRACLDIDEYAERLDAYEVCRQYFRRKSDESFCAWLEEHICDIDCEIEREYINEYDDDDE